MTLSFCKRIIECGLIVHLSADYLMINENFCWCVVAATASVEGKMSKSLKKLMKKVASKEVHEEMAVADAKIGNLIKVYFVAIY